MSDVSVNLKKDIKFQVAILFDVVVPVASHFYERTEHLYNGSMRDKIVMYDTFRDTIIAATNLEEELANAVARPDGMPHDDAVKITIASVQ